MWTMFVVFTCVFAGGVLLVQTMVARQSESEKAFRLLRRLLSHEPTEAERAEQARRIALGRRMRSHLPLVNERVLRPLLHGAGYYTERQADGCVLLWTALLGSGAAAAALLPGPTPLWCLLCFTAAVFGPWLLLRRRGASRRRTIARGLPDVIDLLVVCVEAGLGLDQAVLRVSEELSETHPEIRVELERLLQHQRAGMPRLEAWQKMAERLGIPEVDAFVNMIVQTERFGTPISRALTDFASLSRQKRSQAAEQAAAKTTVKISFPLVLFIFPCMFIVLLGPALLGMVRSLGNIFR